MFTRNPRSDPLFWLVTIVTTAIWTAAALQSLITGDFTGFEIATGPYLIIVGFLAGVKVVRNGNDTKGGSGRDS